MSDLTLHLQYEPDYLPNFVNRCQGKLATIKGVNCYPNLSGVSTLGRVFVDDNLSNALVMQGAGGVEQWIYICRGEYEKAKHVHAWQGPNEFIIDSYEKAARWNEFHIAYIRKMSALGFRCMAGNINTGWPRLKKFGDPPPYPPALRPTIEELVQHDGILSLHEYGPGEVQEDGTLMGSMKFGIGANCLRYRNTVDALRKAGVPIPRIFIGETGIDVPDPNFPLDHHHRGWTEWTDRAGYLEQLRWYAGELAQDEYIIGAAVFTTCNWDWITFNVDRELAMGIADIVAWEPEVVPVVPDIPDTVILKPEPLLFVDISGKLPVNSDVPYRQRRLDQIVRIIIHHTGPPGWLGISGQEYARRIANYHIDKWGWAGSGYTFLVAEDGTIYQTAPETAITNHTYGYNTTGLGIVFIGDFRERHDVMPNEAQLAAGRRLIRYLCDSLGITEVVGHKEKRKTTCPGTSWMAWKKEITG